MALVVKNPPANARDIKDVGSIPGSGRSPGEGHGNTLQYSYLENLMNRGVRQGSQRVGHDLVTEKQLILMLLYFFKIYFNWRLITLQYCGGFCHTFT